MSIDSGQNVGDASSCESPPLDVVWQKFGAQFRRRARTRLRQYGLTGQTESMDICNDVMVDLARQVDTRGLDADDVLAYIMRAIDNQVMDTFRTLARHCRDFRRNEVDTDRGNACATASDVSKPSCASPRSDRANPGHVG